MLLETFCSYLIIIIACCFKYRKKSYKNIICGLKIIIEGKFSHAHLTFFSKNKDGFILPKQCFKSNTGKCNMMLLTEACILDVTSFNYWDSPWHDITIKTIRLFYQNSMVLIWTPWTACSQSLPFLVGLLIVCSTINW